MFTKMINEKCRWLIVLLIGCWLMAGTFAYGQYADYEEEEGPGVILYKHADFRGSKIFIKAGKNVKNLYNMGWNDQISSIELVDNAWIEVYEHANYQGASVTIKDDVINLANFSENIQGTWNDIISSIKVFHGSRYHKYKKGVYGDEERVDCIFYKHANGRGSSFKGKPGNHHSINSGWNDEISSVWIRRGYQVTLYEHDKFQGKRLVLKGEGWKGSLYNLDHYGFNDFVSSYKLVRIRR